MHSPRLLYPARMPEQEKPYKVYKGGRAKGRVPVPCSARPPRSGSDSGAGKAPRREAGSNAVLPAGGSRLAILPRDRADPRDCLARRRATSRSRVGISVRERARPRILSSPSVAQQDALLTSKPTTILLVGTDGVCPVRTRLECQPLGLDHADPDRASQEDRLAFLSIPRDLRVEIPGSGRVKDQFGVPDRGAGARAENREEL